MAMASIEQLRAENERLRTQTNERVEKKRLISENRRLRNPRTSAFIAGVGRVASNVGSKVSSAAVNYSKRQPTRPIQRTRVAVRTIRRRPIRRRQQRTNNDNAWGDMGMGNIFGGGGKRW